MSKLNERTDKPKGIVHLMVTTLCDRSCPHCCNKQYDLNDIPYVTDEELREAHTVFITGGEPFKYSNPIEIAIRLRHKYDIEHTYVYTNACELQEWVELNDHIYKDGDWDNCNNLNLLDNLDGLNISIKNELDGWAIIELINNENFIKYIDEARGKSRIYDFVGVNNTELIKHFNYFKREWQEDFEAADDSIFRKA